MQLTCHRIGCPVWASSLRACISRTRCYETKASAANASTGGRGPTVGNIDTDQDIVGAGFGIFDRYIKITVVVEDPGVNQLVFGLVQPRASLIFLHQFFVRKFALRVFVQCFHVRVRRRRVQIKVTFFHILAVVALRAAQAEQPLFQELHPAHSTTPNPKHRRTLAIRDTQQTVLTPAISTAAGMVVRKIFPSDCRCQNNLREPFPIAVPTDRVPNVASSPGAGHLRVGVDVRDSGPRYPYLSPHDPAGF